MKKKRFTVEVEGHCYYDSDTYRIFAKTKKEALKKAKERFEEETCDQFDIVEAKIKTKKAVNQDKRPSIGEFVRSLPDSVLKDYGFSDKEILEMRQWE